MEREHEDCMQMVRVRDGEKGTVRLSMKNVRNGKPKGVAKQFRAVAGCWEAARAEATLKKG